MKEKKHNGFTFLESLAVIIIILILFNISVNWLQVQRVVFKDYLLLSEYSRQIFLAKTNIERDLFEAESVEVRHNSLVIRNLSGDEIIYYLAADPYSHENLITAESRTLYRKKNQQNAMPITQYLKGVDFQTDHYGTYYKVVVKIKTEKIVSVSEVYYENNSIK